MEGVSSRELTKLVDTRELWFVLIANPDGYDFTFTPENRLWRKNLRDNDDDGRSPRSTASTRTATSRRAGRYDDEGSNSERSSETYHGTGPASEPETQAFLSLMDRVHFTSNKNDHTFGRLLLWPPGWQVDTRFADEPIMTALAGDDENPAIPGFDPDVGAELYTTNGDTNDHLYQSDRTLSFTPEGSRGRRHGQRLHLPGRRGRRSGGVREARAVRARPGALGGRPVAPGQPPRQRGAELRRGRLRGVLRGPADRPGERSP